MCSSNSHVPHWWFGQQGVHILAPALDFSHQTLRKMRFMLCQNNSRHQLRAATEKINTLYSKTFSTKLNIILMCEQHEMEHILKLYRVRRNFQSCSLYRRILRCCLATTSVSIHLS
jgi:hypothetical protein